MNKYLQLTLLSASLWIPSVKAVDVILAGGVALKSWENYRGAEAHDRWWANFIRASTMQMSGINLRDPKAKIVWIVFRPSYITRQSEDGKTYVKWINEHAVKYRAKLVWVKTAKEAVAAINNAPQAGRRIKNFTYFGHSNAYAFMLDYSNDIIGTSTEWIHERDIKGWIKAEAFEPDAVCWSYGCFTGLSMSQRWHEALGIKLWGNTAATRYHPLSQGRMPEGQGAWVR